MSVHSDETLSTRDLAGTPGGAERPPADPEPQRREDGPAAGTHPAQDSSMTQGGSMTGVGATTQDGATQGGSMNEPRSGDTGMGTEQGTVTEPAPAPPEANRMQSDPAAVGPSATSAEAPARPSESRQIAEPLLATASGNEFQSRWTEIQVRFVDEPRGAVREADRLVARVMKELAEGFAQERERLESQWDRGEDISTEDLRVALQRYRSFFQRLLSS